MTKKYAIFVVDGNGKLETAARFSKDDKWIFGLKFDARFSGGKWASDLRFDSREDAEKALDGSYDFCSSMTLEFVILEVLSD